MFGWCWYDYKNMGLEYKKLYSWLKCHDKYKKCLYQLKDGTLLSGSDDKTIKIWKNNKCIKALNQIIIHV